MDLCCECQMRGAFWLLLSDVIHQLHAPGLKKIIYWGANYYLHLVPLCGYLRFTCRATKLQSFKRLKVPSTQLRPHTNATWPCQIFINPGTEDSLKLAVIYSIQTCDKLYIYRKKEMSWTHHQSADWKNCLWELMLVETCQHIEITYFSNKLKQQKRAYVLLWWDTTQQETDQTRKCVINTKNCTNQKKRKREKVPV